MDWLWSNAISLLWMVVVLVVVLVAGNVIYGAAAAIAAGIVLCGRPSEDELKRRAEESARLQRESEYRQQQYWKERHKHENPQCEVCKKEEEAAKDSNDHLLSRPIF